MANNLFKYAVIVPAKNEAEFIRFPLESLAKQNILPVRCLVIDDNSEDETASIVNEFELRYDWISLYKKADDQKYELGSKVVQNFYMGLEYLKGLNIEFNYIIKLDADVAFDNQFMDIISERISNDKIGIISGTPYSVSNSKMIVNHSPEWHTNGDFKIYNLMCLNDIGGLKSDITWDTADNIAAFEKGWNTIVVEEAKYEQKRPMGRYSRLEGIKRDGLGSYKLRYDLVYLFLKILHDLFTPPLILGGIYYVKGYLEGIIRKKPKTLTKKQAKILRMLLWKSLLERIKTNRV
jgi:glycosyltransferase involved in cell wall biosynthesis